MEVSQKMEDSVVIYQGCRFVPSTFLETKPEMGPRDLDIGFQSLALIQGQIYNPVYYWAAWNSAFLHPSERM